LHFESPTRPFANGDGIKEYLRSHIPGYNLALLVFDSLVASTQTAVQHANGILEKHPEGELRFPNPSTQVHLLVQEMIEMSPSGREHFI
jgi:hypothetical protein